MNIPSRVNPFGYDNTTPPGYVRAEFLRGTGDQKIDTGVVKTGEYRAVCEYAGADVLRYGNWFGWNYQADEVTYSNIFRFYGTAYLGRFGHDSTKGYILPSNYNQQGYVGTTRNRLESTEAANRVVLNGDVVTLNIYNINAVSNANPLNLPVLLWFVNGVKIYTFGIFNDVAKDIDLIPVLDPSGVPCMYDTITGQPFRNSGTGSDFIAGMTLDQARNLANLPATGGSLTISIPLEAAFDANVESALETAAAKGWTITVQYRESELTTKNIDADFLESTGEQYIDSGKTLLADTQVKSRFQQTKFNNDAVQRAHWLFGVGKYGASAHLLFGLWDGIAHPTQSGYMIQGEYGGAFQRVADSINIREPLTLEMSRELATLNAEELYYVTTSEFAIGDEVLSYPIFDGIGSAGALGGRSNLRIWYFVDTTPSDGGLRLSLIPAIDSSGVPCMYDTVSGQNFYNANTAEGATPFIVGFETTEKAAISLSKLPVTTAGELTVSLPAAAQNKDTLVPDAIDIATNRGWTIITQYRED